MMKKVFILFVMLLFISGCKSTSFDNKKQGAFSSVCKSSSNSEEVLTEITTTTNYNDDNYVIYQKVDTNETFYSKEAYDELKDSYQKLYTTYENNNDIDFTYNLDEENMKISYTMIYKESVFNYSHISDEEKAKYHASYVIKSAEDSGETCDLGGASRTLIGLE